MPRWICNDCGLPIVAAALEEAERTGGPVRCLGLYRLHPVPAVHSPERRARELASQLPRMVLDVLTRAAAGGLPPRSLGDLLGGLRRLHGLTTHAPSSGTVVPNEVLRALVGALEHLVNLGLVRRDGPDYYASLRTFPTLETLEVLARERLWVTFDLDCQALAVLEPGATTHIEALRRRHGCRPIAR